MIKLTPPKLLASKSRIVLGIIAVVFFIVFWVWMAPAERVLGDGIKIVYLHVAATWAGMTGILLIGVLGVLLIVREDRQWISWGESVAWAAITLYALGFLLSIQAARVNWGGFFWAEPRTAATLRVLVLGLLVQGVSGWRPRARWKGLLWLVLAGYLIWSVRIPDLILHPRDPIGTATSPAIQTTFYGLFVLMLVVGGLLSLLIHKR